MYLCLVAFVPLPEGTEANAPTSLFMPNKARDWQDREHGNPERSSLFPEVCILQSAPLSATSQSLHGTSVVAYPSGCPPAVVGQTCC